MYLTECLQFFGILYKVLMHDLPITKIVHSVHENCPPRRRDLVVRENTSLSSIMTRPYCPGREITYTDCWVETCDFVNAPTKHNANH